MILAVCPNPSVDTYAWVETLEPRGVHRIQKERRYPGGKGVHVALAAAELGEEVTLLAFWGGESGQWIKKECEKQNIHCIGPEVSGWSRICITFKSKGKYDDTELLGSGPEISIDEYTAFKQEYEQFIKNCEVVTLSGSWPEGTPGESYAELISTANRFNKKTILDAAGVHFELALKQRPYGIHLNYAEASIVTGKNSVSEMFSYFLDNVELVALTKGNEGLYLGKSETLIHGNVSIGTVHSAVGSGDCLTAGIVVGLMQSLDDINLTKLGVACGAANCIREDLGMFYKKDVMDLIGQVKTEIRMRKK